MPQTSVSLLERACSQSDAQAWQRLATLYAPLLESWLRKYALQNSDVEDLVQEVLLTLSRELASFEHSGRVGAFRCWLRTILVHRLQAYWRSERNRPLASGESRLQRQLNELADDSSETSRLWDAEHDRHVVSRLLEQVRPRFLEKTWLAFRRHMLDGQPADAVAAELEIPIQAVYVAKSRVLNALRREAAGLVDC
jgi:RNA polymerase sigma-70 factor (ECF subfamily)